MMTEDKQSERTQSAGIAHDFSAQPNTGMQELAPGTLLDERYLIENELGRGGVGIVYRACDRDLHNRSVVVKILLTRRVGSELEAWYQKKFRQEVEALARLRHPNIVEVLGVGKAPNGVPYLVMQFIEGTSLRTMLKRGLPDLARVADIVRQLSHALSAAHKEGVFHRDLKPENVMLEDLGYKEEVAKLIDFGIATVLDSPAAQSTGATVVVGTLPYMAPEQMIGQPMAASDIYALGVMAFEMLTGQLPFSANSTAEQYSLQQAGVILKPLDLRSDLPVAAQEAILKALSFDPKMRHASARDFGEEFAKALTNAASVSPGSSAATVLDAPQPEPTKDRRAFRKAAWLAACLLLFGGLLWGGKWFFSQGEADKELTLAPLTLHWYGFGQRQRGGGWFEFPVRDGVTMYSGEQFRLAFSLNEDCYLYVINLNTQDKVELLFPNKAIKIDNLVRRAQQYELPDGANWFTLDDRPGIETLYFLASYDPLEKMDELARKLSTQAPSADLQQELQNEIQTLARVPEPVNGAWRTRSGKVVVRGINIQPDQRYATTTLSNGQRVTQEMQNEPGALRVVKRIQIHHAAKP